MTNDVLLRGLTAGAALIALALTVPAGDTAAQGTGSPAAAPAPATIEAAARDARAAVAQAREAARQHKIRAAINEIERAETALLNLEEVQRRDPRIDVALKQLDAARDAVSRRDVASTERQLAQAENLLAAATSAPAVAGGATAPGALPVSADSMSADQTLGLMGREVVDVNGADIGPVVDIVLDDGGAPTSVIIGVAGPADGRATTVAVPMTHLKAGDGRVVADQSRERLRSAAAYRTQPPAESGGSMPPPGAPQR